MKLTTYAPHVPFLVSVYLQMDITMKFPVVRDMAPCVFVCGTSVLKERTNISGYSKKILWYLMYTFVRLGVIS